MKKLKLWNGKGWNCKGYLYVCAYSRAHAARISSEAYRILRGLKNHPDINATTVNEIRIYWHEGLWGDPMKDVSPEIGVWYSKEDNGKPVRIYPES